MYTFGVRENSDFISTCLNNIFRFLCVFYSFRPFFTYWVTFVQVVVFIVSVAVYGIAPIGHSETEYTEAVSTPIPVT